MKRRQFLAASVLAGYAARPLLAGAAPSAGSIKPVGKLIHDCSLPGQGRAHGAFPAHPNGLRLSRDRFLVLYATRGWRGVDEDRSIIYQVRSGDYNGPVLKEGLLAASIDTWDSLGDGSRHFKAHGHPGGFGVPKGALIDGKPAPHANLFVLKWYRYARIFSGPDRLDRPLAEASVQLMERTLGVEWVHVRLNDADNDLEIVEPARALRAPGFAPDDPVAERINQTYCQPLPLNRDATEWVDLFGLRWPDRARPDATGPAPVKFRYDSARRRYVWTETGPKVFPAGLNAGEGGMVRLDDGWAMYARPHKDAGLPVLWARLDDPFSASTRQVLARARTGQPIVRGPVTAYRCADGVLRVFAGSREISPYANRRHPLYCWEADPSSDFALSRRQVVCDLLAGKTALRPESEPIADMCKVLPHHGGRTQWIVHRFRTESIDYRRERPASTNPEPQFQVSPAVTEAERDAHGIYLAKLDLAAAAPDPWTFAASR